MNPYNQGVFTMTAPCLPCCGGTPVECMCANVIPWLFDSPLYPDIGYLSLADAQTAISTMTCGCLVYTPFGTTAGTTINTATANQIVIMPDAFVGTSLLISITIPDSTTLTLTATGTGNDATMYLYDCFYNGPVDFSSGATSTTLLVATGGTYYVQIINGATVLTLSANTSMIFNPVIALYDDSGTIRQLEACPKFLLPILTELSGDWYADATEAAAVLADPLAVSNCIGYYDSTTSADSFTATDGGTSLTFSFTKGGLGTRSFQRAWGSINAEQGETVTVSPTGSMYASLRIYDYTGIFIQDLDTLSGPGTSNPLPYTGKYIVYAGAFSTPFDPPFFSASAIITSSGTMSVNPIQALYDYGLDCPARLDC